MRVSGSAVKQYRDALIQLGVQASDYVFAALETASETDVAELRELAIRAISATIGAQGSVAQAMSMQLFDAMCAAEGIDAGPALMFEDAIDRDLMVEKVHYYARDLVMGARAKFDKEAADLAEYYVRRCAYENTVRNCGEYNVRYARIPSGGETCDFCVMLASRGFVYHTEVTAKGEHGVHAHCRCIVMPGKKGRTAIEGYDPNEWFAKWAGIDFGGSGSSVAARRQTNANAHYMSDEEAAKLGKQWLKGVYGKGASKDDALWMLAAATNHLYENRANLSPDAYNSIADKIERARFRRDITIDELREAVLQMFGV